MSVCFIPPYTPLLYSKTGVYRGSTLFSYSCSKPYIVGTHNICFEQEYENSKNKSTENCHFYRREKSLYIAWACLRNEQARSLVTAL